MASWTPDFARRSSVDDVVASINDILAASDTVTTTPTTSRWNAGPAISPMRIMQIHPVLSGSAKPVGPMTGALNDTLAGQPSPTEPLQGRQGVEQARIEPLKVQMPAPATGGGTAGAGVASVVQAAKAAGFTGEQLVMAVAVSLAENSGSVPDLVNTTGNHPRTSRDRGIFQINDYWHPEVSDKEAFDPLASARHAYRISNGGRNWKQWAAYNNKAYQRFMRAAQNAVAQYSANTPGYVGSTPPESSTPAALEQPPVAYPSAEAPKETPEDAEAKRKATRAASRAGKSVSRAVRF